MRVDLYDRLCKYISGLLISKQRRINLKKLVLFDWNDTLLDDTALWYDAVCEVFRMFGKQPPTIEQYFRELEGDYFSIYTSRGVALTRDELNEVYARFYQAIMHRASLMPSAKELLQILKANGHSSILVTGQHEHLTSPLIEKFGLASYFQRYEFHVTNKTATINAILQTENTDPKNCFYVGDTPSDVRHAKKAGVVAIAFLGGHIPNEIIAHSQPDHTVRHLADILTIA